MSLFCSHSYYFSVQPDTTYAHPQKCLTRVLSSFIPEHSIILPGN